MTALHRGKLRLGKQILAVSEGLFAHTFDAALWLSAYIVALGGTQKGKPGSVWRAGDETDRFLEEINYRSIKNAVITATRKGLIKTVRRGAAPEITQAGRQRLKMIIPRYDEKRVWDGRLHLITYDIPEKKRKDRNVLRLHLVRLGCAKLQESVWLTPYDPVDTLRSFIEEKGLGGTIIVSNLGREASIGEEDTLSLIVRIYGLETVNERYEEWLTRFGSGPVDRYAVVTYLAILKNDPQLPFALLPKWWKGDTAYQIIKPLLSKLSI